MRMPELEYLVARAGINRNRGRRVVSTLHGMSVARVRVACNHVAF
jgi:hypothetical protein